MLNESERRLIKKSVTALSKRTHWTRGQAISLITEIGEKHKPRASAEQGEAEPTEQAEQQPQPEFKAPEPNEAGEMRIEDILPLGDELLDCDMEPGKRYEVGMTTTTTTRKVECLEIRDRYVRVVCPIGTPKSRWIVNLRNKELSFWPIDVSPNPARNV